MQVHAPHVVTLLQELGQEDATCRRFAHYAKQGEPILDVCQGLIRALVADKETLRKLVIDMTTKPQT